MEKEEKLSEDSFDDLVDPHYTGKQPTHGGHGDRMHMIGADLAAIENEASCCACVVSHKALISKVERCSYGCAHTHVGHHSTYDELFDAIFLKNVLQFS